MPVLDAIRLALTVLLLVALPGFLLVNAAFPRRTGSRIERAYLSVAAGALLLILVGVTLGFLPHGERGFFQTGATGFPSVELGMVTVSGGLLYLGVRRGAYGAPQGRCTRT